MSLSTKCTFYKNIISHIHKNGPLTTPGNIVPIIDLLTKQGYTNSNLLNDLRNSGYKSDFYNENKASLSAACFSSVQDNLTIDRTDKNHLFHTGYIAFDIDTDKNPYLLTDGESIKEYLIEKIPYIAYIGKSVSNLGYWGLMQILNKEDHYGHYEAMKQLFAANDVILDKTSDISRLRFIAYDPDGHINDNALTFNDSIETEKTIGALDYYERKASHEFYISACRWVEAKYDIKFQQGSIHNYLLYLYATLRGCHVSRENVLNWIYNNLIEEALITTNCLDEPKWTK